jgi:thiol-disulfide isomerase/thioredoxin
MKKLLLLTLCTAMSLARAGEPRTVRAVLVPMADRKPAQVFVLRNAAGKAVRTSHYRGRVVLLDFWATECGGCKVEIPGFIGLQQEYKNKGLTAVGISMDILYEGLKSAEEGWGRVNPFVKQEGVNYPILMGDDAVSKAYNIQAMPATYLLDRKGRIAATYIGIVNQTDIETNLKILIAE